MAKWDRILLTDPAFVDTWGEADCFSIIYLASLKFPLYTENAKVVEFLRLQGNDDVAQFLEDNDELLSYIWGHSVDDMVYADEFIAVAKAFLRGYDCKYCNHGLDEGLFVRKAVGDVDSQYTGVRKTYKQVAVQLTSYMASESIPFSSSILKNVMTYVRAYANLRDIPETPHAIIQEPVQVSELEY